jgi:aspartyl protease family protein
MVLLQLEPEVFAMMKLIVSTFIGVSVLAALPHYASDIMGSFADRQGEQAEIAASSALEAEARLFAANPAEQHTASYAIGSSMRIAPDAQGHFSGAFRINGRTVDGLIDTGATYVAMNLSTARRLGVNPPHASFTHGVSTANGETSAARVTLDRMAIGPIEIRDVEAFVLDDSKLSITLIGMSFMNRLESFRVEDGELLLIN